jgi:hypothetical protein
MLSHDDRRKFLDIAKRIQNKEEVSLSEMIFAGKMAQKDTRLNDILTQAQRRSFRSSPPEPDSLDEFLDNLNLGKADPEDHLDSQSSVDDFANFFRRDLPENWRQTD